MTENIHNQHRVYLYSIWVRVWHWINAFLCLILIITGLSMQYSNPGFPVIRFDWAVSIHNIAGIILTASYLVFIIMNMVTNNGSHYKLKWRGLKDRVLNQFRYYTFGIFRKEQPPYPINEKRKFNPLQKVTYVVVMYLFFPIIIITGWALLLPEVTIHNVFGASGLHLTDLVHLIIGFFISVFLLVHIYFGTIGAKPSSHYKAMLTGWHDKHD